MGRKLTIFMPDDVAIGPKIVEIGNWSGKALYAPRGSLKSFLGRSEFGSPGIYFLRNQSESAEFEENVYIGEAEILRTRLKQHIAERDFESVVCFLSKDELLTKAHIRFLERKLIMEAREANNAYVENTNVPRSPRLSEGDVSDMEYFIDQIRLILPVVGLNVLVPAAPHAVGDVGNGDHRISYHLRSNTLAATMVEMDGAFIVLTGSQANPDVARSMAPGWRRIRRKLIDAGVLKQRGRRLVFNEDVRFSSPSAAASVVLGRQAPGPISWLEENGRTYKEVQEATADPE